MDPDNISITAAQVRIFELLLANIRQCCLFQFMNLIIGNFWIPGFMLIKLADHRQVWVTMKGSQCLEAGSPMHVQNSSPARCWVRCSLAVTSHQATTRGRDKLIQQPGTEPRSQTSDVNMVASSQIGNCNSPLHQIMFLESPEKLYLMLSIDRLFLARYQ